MKPTEKTLKTDESGNRIIMSGNAIVLHLRAEKKRRTIAEVDIKNRQLFMVRDRGKHLFNRADAYGFNHAVLSMAEQCEAVYLREVIGPDRSVLANYRIPIKTILESGSFLHFKTEGFERQIFLSRAIIAGFKTSADYRPF